MLKKANQRPNRDVLEAVIGVRLFLCYAPQATFERCVTRERPTARPPSHIFAKFNSRPIGRDFGHARMLPC